jgi:gliding motility-associated-like protein
MSLSPESFDRLLADKLAQAPAPAYDPAHWDQLEDQLQHLNQALRQQPGQSAPPAPAAPTVLAPLAKVGVVALLAGLTAVNGYFFFAAQQQPLAPAVSTSAPSVAPTEEVVTSSVEQALPGDTDEAAPVQEAPVAPASKVLPAPSVVRRAAQPAPIASVPVVAPTEKVGASVLPAALPPTVVAPLIQTPPAVVPDRVTSDNTPSERTDSSSLRTAGPEQALNRLAQEVWNIITPNGDGKNDYFELPLPVGTCRLMIYDQRNRLVFSSQQYNNSWDANGLPAGNYFYLVETNKPTPWRSTGKIEVVK